MNDLIEQLQRGVDTNEPPDKTDRIMTKAADEIVRLTAALEEIVRNGDQGIHVPGPYDIAKEALAKEGK